MQTLSSEYIYLNTVRDILETGSKKTDRTGTGTLSKFGVQMRYDLSTDSFPLLTTKRVYWKGVVEELLWIISGKTDTNILAKKGVHFWDENTSREFLDNCGFLDRKVGDLGPGYGFQWRHFGATYVDAQTNYVGQGVDQLAECIRKIKESPDDRRIVLSAWNPSDLDMMALPPCHMFCQFYVNNGALSCQMYQRSADLGLGVPFNIASYSLLTKMIAHICGLTCGEFIHCIGDAHIYLNHIDALKKQLEREPRDFPTLRIISDKTSIDDFSEEDFELSNYNPYPNIKMKMAV
jgi:thymidylate synthase